MFGSAYKSTISQLDLPGSNISRVLAITIKKKIKKAFLLQKHKYRCVLFRGPDVGRTENPHRSKIFFVCGKRLRPSGGKIDAFLYN